MYVWLCVYVCHCTHWRSEDNLWEPALSFHHVVPEDQTAAISLGKKCLYPLRRLANPYQKSQIQLKIIIAIFKNLPNDVKNMIEHKRNKSKKLLWKLEMPTADK